MLVIVYLCSHTSLVIVYLCGHTSVLLTCSRELQTQKLRSPVWRTQSYSLPLKPGVGQNYYSHACFAHCQEFVPCPSFYFPGPFTFIFYNSSHYFLTVSVLANAVSRVFPRNNVGHIGQSQNGLSRLPRCVYGMY